MADTVSFTTSDEPPHSLAVTKAALYGSKVFRDMLDIGSDAEPVPLDDKAVGLIPLFEIPRGQVGRVEMDKWPAEAWESLARLADVYDVGEPRELLGKKTPLLGFTLATLINDKRLINESAFPAAGGLPVPRGIRFEASSEWKQRLNDYATRIKLHAYETLISTLPCFDPRNPVEWECDKTSCSAEEHERYWQETLLRGMRSYNYRPSDKVFRDTSMGGVWIDIHPQAPGDDYDLCVYHRLELREKAKTLDAKSMSSMPSFL